MEEEASGSGQRLDAPTRPISQEGRVQQPKPQVIRTGPSSILVSPRQKGNPILNHIRALPWEYAETPADYILGLTTCALFLSLKYHRLHPEYIYGRIRGIAHKYNLRVLLTMVDIENHEESLKELSKTSLINNVTLVLCWSSQEAARYLELFKSYEHAAPTSIRAHQSTTYSDRLVEFITVPRSINKTDAVSLVSSFGSIRTAVNARPEEISLVAGWGEKKVQRWCSTVRENFRVRKAAKRAVGDRSPVTRDLSEPVEPEQETSRGRDHDEALATRLGISSTVPASMDPSKTGNRTTSTAAQAQRTVVEAAGPDQDEELAMMEAAGELPARPPPPKKIRAEDGMSEGITAALEKLRRQT